MDCFGRTIDLTSLINKPDGYPQGSNSNLAEKKFTLASVVKPFSPKELMARIKAVIKRNSRPDSGIPEKLKFEGLEIDLAGREVYVDGVKASMTPKEYDLLFYLVKNKNLALTRDKLLEEVWGYDFFGDDRTVDTHIKMLRNSLGPYRKFIVTLRGMGYKFEYGQN